MLIMDLSYDFSLVKKGMLFFMCHAKDEASKVSAQKQKGVK